jgi:hypothetical protein
MGTFDAEIQDGSRWTDQGGQVAVVTDKVLGIPRQKLENWVTLDGTGKMLATST